MNIAIFGIGNILLSDDGVGVHVINRLNKEYRFPENVARHSMAYSSLSACATGRSAARMAGKIPPMKPKRSAQATPMMSSNGVTRKANAT